VKFRLDENLPAELVADLRRAGHTAQTVHQEGLTGSCDSTLLERAHSEERVLLTLDRGLGDVKKHALQHYSGVVILRPRQDGRSYVRAFVRRRLPDFETLPLKGRLVIASEIGLRLR
jgi:predicted nuclease of predicted toxin-antitoxin system